MRLLQKPLIIMALSILVFPVIYAAPNDVSAVTLGHVVESVRSQYPPQLAALIEQDIANGRVRSAMGAFDWNLNAGGASNLAGFYDGRSGFANLEKPLSFWGGSVYGGYRLSSGFLADYNKERTGVDGEVVLGFKVPLLRDGTIDRRRATLWQAEIDQQLAEPFILRQYLDFIRASTVSYYTWLASGKRLEFAEELFRIAQKRDSAIAEQVQRGASARIVQVDNKRLVVSRQISVVQAKRRFEAAAIELSLFLRNKETAEPILARREQLPADFPSHTTPKYSQMAADIDMAWIRRPEVRRIELTIEKTNIDMRLAKNNLMPSLELGLNARQRVSGPQDIKKEKIDREEVEAKLEFRLPLERREAKGRVDVAQSQISRLQNERQFARDRIAADVRDSYSALIAAQDTLRQTRINVNLAQQLEDAENEKLEHGATDLLALQIREQATFDARVLEVDALLEHFRAEANYRAAVASDAPDPAKSRSK
jgi:outer membrane protein TolC